MGRGAMARVVAAVAAGRAMGWETTVGGENRGSRLLVTPGRM